MAYTAPTNATPGTDTAVRTEADAGAYRGYQILHFGFTVLPIIAGIDKFFDALTDWDKYLAPIVPATLHMASHTFMQIVGVIEIIAGLLVAFVPRIGGYVVAAWLAGIIVNLVLNPNHYWDVGARDFGLLLGALALGSLSAWARARA